MSNERFQAKNFFQLNGGLNTEFNELNFQDGFTSDEANYELLVDGSRRRRKGLAAESGAGSAKTIDTLGSGYINQTYLWLNVGGNPDKKLMVFRTGDYLYFADADETISDGWMSGNGSFINLDAYRSDSATNDLVRKEALSFSQGRGHLFVSGQYILPFYVEYDSTADEVTGTQLAVQIRDYTTIDDGTAVFNEPTSLTDDHRYNLLNRGWELGQINQYNTDQSKYPARNSIWYKGYKRVDTTTGVLPEDGTQQWDSAKLDAEAFGSSEAPTGSMFIKVNDTTEGFSNKDTGGVIAITAHSYSAGTHTLTTASAHGLGVGVEVVITGNSFTYDASEGGDTVEYQGTLDGTRTTITGTSGSTITVSYTPPLYNSNFTSVTAGEVDTSGKLDRSSGTDHGDSFRAIEFHAGRVFYGGMLNSEFNDYLFFSQIGDKANKYDRCFQDADPTDENFNALVPTDGGYAVIPGMGGVLNLVSVRNSLIVLAKNGVWEVNGGRAGVFTPDGYGVRKITSSGASGPEAFCAVEDSLVYSGPGGIYIIAPNQYTGILEATSVSENTIQTLWNQIPDAEQERLKMEYDNATKRMYLMYGPNGTSIGIDTMLIYDVRAQAWFKYTFDTPTDNVLLTGFALDNADDTSDNKKMKFIYEASTTTVQVADFDQTSFNDWDGTNGPLPYMVFGDDNIGDWQSRRQAPVISVYSKRTNTGYTQVGDDWNEDNPSSTLMTPFWDWTDERQYTSTAKAAQEDWDGTVYTSTPSVSGKIGQQKEVFRDVRNFVPSAADDLSGYPVVVTRNKIRGRGRSLRIRFDGATDKDSHILGFTINYKVPRRNNV